MNPETETEAVSLATAVRDGLKDFDFEKVAVGICPSFVHMPLVKKAIEGSKIKLGAQDSYFVPEGAFTGEVSVNQLAEYCQMIIVGHSERRQFFSETDETVNRKTKGILDLGLQPILCVGESMDIRNSGKQVEFVVEQLKKDLDGFLLAEIEKIIIAYEPIWAIGTGVVATSEQAREIIDEIRLTLDRTHELGLGKKVPILYGGSTNGDNAEDLAVNSGCDGFLVGGASLKSEQFIKICDTVAK